MKLGTENIGGIYVGGSKIVQAYLGENAVFESGRLPSGYTELEYIKSDGTQYINTEVKPNQNTDVLLNMYMGTATSKWLYCMGAKDGTNSYVIFAQSSSGTVQAQYGTQTVDIVLNSALTNGANISIRRNSFAVNGNDKQLDQEQFDISFDFFLFTYNHIGSANTSRMAQMKLYSCQMYDNGTPIRDFIPSKNPSGEIGLYDTVVGKFYKNAGTGSFTAGPTV